MCKYTDMHVYMSVYKYIHVCIQVFLYTYTHGTDTVKVAQFNCSRSLHFRSSVALTLFVCHFSQLDFFPVTPHAVVITTLHWPLGDARASCCGFKFAIVQVCRLWRKVDRFYSGCICVTNTHRYSLKLLPLLRCLRHMHALYYGSSSRCKRFTYALACPPPVGHSLVTTNQVSSATVLKQYRAPRGVNGSGPAGWFLDPGRQTIVAQPLQYTSNIFANMLPQYKVIG